MSHPANSKVPATACQRLCRRSLCHIAAKCHLKRLRDDFSGSWIWIPPFVAEVSETLSKSQSCWLQNSFLLLIVFSIFPKFSNFCYSGLNATIRNEKNIIFRIQPGTVRRCERFVKPFRIHWRRETTATIAPHSLCWVCPPFFIQTLFNNWHEVLRYYVCIMVRMPTWAALTPAHLKFTCHMCVRVPSRSKGRPAVCFLRKRQKGGIGNVEPSERPFTHEIVRGAPLAGEALAQTKACLPTSNAAVAAPSAKWLLPTYCALHRCRRIWWFDGELSPHRHNMEEPTKKKKRRACVPTLTTDEDRAIATSRPQNSLLQHDSALLKRFSPLALPLDTPAWSCKYCFAHLQRKRRQ